MTLRLKTNGVTVSNKINNFDEFIMYKNILQRGGLNYRLAISWYDIRRGIRCRYYLKYEGIYLYNIQHLLSKRNTKY